MYHIIEIQTTDTSSVVVTPIPSAQNQNDAESIYHQKMSYAAISSVPVHAVVMVNDHGTIVMNGYYAHIVAQPEENGEEQGE